MSTSSGQFLASPDEKKKSSSSSIENEEESEVPSKTGKCKVSEKEREAGPPLTLNAKRCRAYRQRKQLKKTISGTDTGTTDCGFSIKTFPSMNALYCQRYRNKKRIQKQAKFNAALTITNENQKTTIENDKEGCGKDGKKRTINAKRTSRQSKKLNKTAAGSALETARSKNALYCQRYRNKKRIQKQRNLLNAGLIIINENLQTTVENDKEDYAKDPEQPTVNAKSTLYCHRNKEKMQQWELIPLIIINQKGEATVEKEKEGMMPSIDHCISNSSEMTTLTKTLEVFDTYKHRDDKDSDEESFHLPLDDDESEQRSQEPAKNGNGNESEEEILNKFESASATLDPIDSQLEERLLNEDEEDKKGSKKETSDSTPSKDQVKENGYHVNGDDASSEDLEKDESPKDESKTVNSESEDSSKTKMEVAKESEDVNEASVSNAMETDDVPNVDVVDNLPSKEKEDGAIDPPCDKENAQSKTDEPMDSPNVDKPSNEDVSVQNTEPKENSTVEEQAEKLPSNKIDLDDNARQIHEEEAGDSKSLEKCDNDSSKQNEDSEDLFDISVIRDAEEDNAESAYNEAHPEENEDYDERSDEKMEEDSPNDKTQNEEDEEEEMEIDKNEDQLKASDDVDIEETNLKLDCDTTKDSVSDGEGESSAKTDLVPDNEQKPSDAKDSATECRLDEVTGNLVSSDGKEVSVGEQSAEGAAESKDNEDSSARSSLKRPLSEENLSPVSKKSRTEQVAEVEIKEVEKPKEKLPLKQLLSLSDFMKSRKHNKRLTMHDLEEFCVQKICEVIVHKSELGDVHHQLKMQEQLIETMRKEIQQLTKQARDLEIVNKKLLNDLKQQTSTPKPLNPLKITRSVGLQVKFTPSFEANLKRRQSTAVATNQKVPVQTAPVRGGRVVPSVVAPPLARQVPSPQKQQQQQQQQQLSKPSTPLLSQALQTRRTIVPDTTAKSPVQPARAKPSDSRPSASVIDLTDEDDKKDKNKAPSKMVPPKNITVPLRTTPMRVNATAQAIRLTTSQGKVSPITSVVNSSTPQVMYVVQSSSGQNVLASSLGPKAVVVNFQSANGVITSALNGSAVSVIPKQGNTIQLKTVAPPPPKPIQNSKMIKNKHPAPLPAPPVVRLSLDKPLKQIPPKPHLTIKKTDTGIILQWKMPYELDMYEVIASYQLYAYQETSASPSTDMWRKVGDVKALALPMACTLTQFADKNKYYFAVRAVDIHKRIGMFSDPEEISL